MNTPPKKILFISNSIFFSGAEKILLNLIKGLANKQMFTIYLITGYEGELFEKAKELGINTSYVNMQFNLFAFRILRHFIVSLKIILFVIKNKIQIIYCNRAITGKYGSIAKIFTGAKCVWHLHDFHNNYLGEKFAKISDLMIAVSDSVKKSFPFKYQDKIIVLHNGIDLNNDYKRDQADENLNFNLSINSRDIIITLPGRITEWKGQEFLIRVAANIVKQRDNIKFLILGDVIGNSIEDINYKKNIIALIENLELANNIFITGWTNYPERIIETSYLILNCSLKPEPLATTILEAMHMGKPVICLDSGGNSEMVKDGETGIVVKSKDIMEFTNAIFKILDDEYLYKEMIAGSLKRAQLFSYKKFINNIITLLVNLNGNKK